MSTEATEAGTPIIERAQAATPRAHVTLLARVSRWRIWLFMIAIPDFQKPHWSNKAARALPFNWTSAVAHGALVRDIAANHLIFSHLSRTHPATKTHATLDAGGSYKSIGPVFVGEK